MQKKRSAILIIMLCVVACSTYVQPVLPTLLPTVATPEATFVMTDVVPSIAVVPTATQEPTATADKPPTFIPMPTYEPTPTQIETQTIIEVTPLGGDYGWSFGKIESATGTYTPYNTQNVRWGPGLDYARRYTLSAGQTVRFYAWVSSLPFEAWLCLDAPLGEGIGNLCSEAVAMVYDMDEFGEVVFDD